MIRVLIASLCFVATANASPSAASAAANGPDCSAQAPFYWEIGDANGVIVSGRVGGFLTRDSVLSLASASKWIYGAYVEQVKKVTIDDLKYLNLRSGWTQFDQCQQADTVRQCADRAGYVRRTDGKFDYGGGHMQKHAVTIGLGSLDNTELAAKINTTLLTNFAYTSPQLAGGARASTASYVTMLRRMMRGELAAGSHLADDGVPTQGSQAIKSPIPEPWLYGRGHWIELDGTASSPGAFGFYPWINGNFYGVVARQAAGDAWGSVTCGRTIRRAFLGS